MTGRLGCADLFRIGIVERVRVCQSKELRCVLAELIDVGGQHKCAYPMTPATIGIALVSGSDCRRDHAVGLQGLSNHGSAFPVRTGLTSSTTGDVTAC